MDTWPVSAPAGHHRAQLERSVRVDAGEVRGCWAGRLSVERGDCRPPVVWCPRPCPRGQYAEVAIAIATGTHNSCGGTSTGSQACTHG
jgi:hypothetical protein